MYAFGCTNVCCNSVRSAMDLQTASACVLTAGDLFCCACHWECALQAGKVPVRAMPKSGRGQPARLCFGQFVLFVVGARRAGLVHHFHLIFYIVFLESLCSRVCCKEAMSHRCRVSQLSHPFPIGPALSALSGHKAVFGFHRRLA